MKQLMSEIEINASPERVWEVLTDFTALGEWSPFVRSINGRLDVGETLKVYIKASKGMGMPFKPKVLKAVAGQEFRWLGRFLVPGLFDGEHYFIIEQLDGDRVQFIQGEIFTGLLVPVMSILKVMGNAHLGFQEMNQALKERAEQPPR